MHLPSGEQRCSCAVLDGRVGVAFRVMISHGNVMYVLFEYLSESVAHFCCPLKGTLGMLTEMAASLASESTWHFCHAGLRDHAELSES